jgi:hypothetical protein
MFINNREDYFNVLNACVKHAIAVQICTYGITPHPQVINFLEWCPKPTRVLVGIPYNGEKATREYVRGLKTLWPELGFRVHKASHAKFVRFEFITQVPYIVIGSHNMTGGQSADVSIVTDLYAQSFLTTFEQLWREGKTVRARK